MVVRDDDQEMTKETTYLHNAMRRGQPRQDNHYSKAMPLKWPKWDALGATRTPWTTLIPSFINRLVNNHAHEFVGEH